MSRISGVKLNMSKGELITINPDNTVRVPDNPVISFIEGDGIGPEIWRAAKMVLDHAVSAAYRGERIIAWQEALAGEKAFKETGQVLPEATVDAIRKTVVAIKGPLTTPVGGGIRSLNVALRQILDLYACVRPAKYIPGVPSPVREPEKVNMVIFRENTEDVYAGVEWHAGSPEALRLIEFLRESFGAKIREDSGIGIKPISETCTKRLVRKAILYAIDIGYPVVTLVHKGNIMKFTEGAFRSWGYELAHDEFKGRVITEDEVWEHHGGKRPGGLVMINDRIADAMFQHALLRPDEYGVLATPNLNGDYLSDALAAQVGGLGLAPGANIGDGYALFEATHGSAPKYAGQDKVNPSSLILSGKMMLDYLGWREAAVLVERGLERAIAKKIVTYDLARQMAGAKEVSLSAFAEEVVNNLAR